MSTKFTSGISLFEFLIILNTNQNDKNWWKMTYLEMLQLNHHAGKKMQSQCPIGGVIKLGGLGSM